MTTLKGSHSVVLVDVSATGARLRGIDLPKESDEMFITVEGVIAFGTVAWVRDGELGLAFDRPLRPEEGKHLRRKVALTAGLPPDIRAALDDWMLGVAR